MLLEDLGADRHRRVDGVGDDADGSLGAVLGAGLNEKNVWSSLGLKSNPMRSSRLDRLRQHHIRAGCYRMVTKLSCVVSGCCILTACPAADTGGQVRR